MRRADAAGGNRARTCAIHARVGQAFVPLVESGGTARDQRGSEQGVQQQGPRERRTGLHAEQEPDGGAHQDETGDARLGEVGVGAEEIHEVTAD